MKSLVYVLVGCWVAVRQAVSYWWDRDYRPLYRTAYELGRDALETDIERWQRRERLIWLAKGMDAETLDRLQALALEMYVDHPHESVQWWWWMIRNRHEAGLTFDQIEKYVKGIFNANVG